jgi:hypothetical protein
MNSVNNPKYLQKLGIVRNAIQYEVGSNNADRDAIVVDELCNIIIKGCSLSQFK